MWDQSHAARVRDEVLRNREVGKDSFSAGLERGPFGTECAAQAGAFGCRTPGSDRRIRCMRRSNPWKRSQNPVHSAIECRGCTAESSGLDDRMRWIPASNPPGCVVECSSFAAESTGSRRRMQPFDRRMQWIGRSVPAAFRPVAPLRTSIRRCRSPLSGTHPSHPAPAAARRSPPGSASSPRSPDRAPANPQDLTQLKCPVRAARRATSVERPSPRAVLR